MSKTSQDLEKAIANVAKADTCLPRNIPEWMQKMGILPEDVNNPSCHLDGTGQINCDRRICVFFIAMKWMLQNQTRISSPVPNYQLISLFKMEMKGLRSIF